MTALPIDFTQAAKEHETCLKQMENQDKEELQTLFEERFQKIHSRYLDENFSYKIGFACQLYNVYHILSQGVEG